MLRLKNSLIALAGLFALISLIALVTPTKSVGQSGKPPQPQDVRLVGTSVTQPVSATSPLPVEGSVTVANTPTVRIDPAENTVRIDAVGPLPVRVVNNPVTQPFTFSANLLWDDGNQFQVVYVPVPAGKRLVIEQISLKAHLAPTPIRKVLMWVATQASNGGDVSSYQLAATDVGLFNGSEVFIASSQVKCYADAGSIVQIVVQLTERGDVPDNGVVSLSGYLVDVV